MRHNYPSRTLLPGLCLREAAAVRSLLTQLENSSHLLQLEKALLLNLSKAQCSQKQIKVLSGRTTQYCKAIMLQPKKKYI